jgi:hypothetical protein
MTYSGFFAIQLSMFGAVRRYRDVPLHSPLLYETITQPASPAQ